MIVLDAREKGNIRYDELDSGSVYEYCGLLYMKTMNNLRTEHTYSVNLVTGELTYLYKHEQVKKVNAKVVIE